MEKAMQATAEIFKLLDLVKFETKNDFITNRVTLDWTGDEKEMEKKVEEFKRQMQLLNIFESKKRRTEIFSSLIATLDKSITEKTSLLEQYKLEDKGEFKVAFVGSDKQLSLPKSSLIGMCQNSIKHLLYFKDEIEQYIRQPQEDTQEQIITAVIAENEVAPEQGTVSEIPPEVKKSKVEDPFDETFTKLLEAAEKKAEKHISRWKQNKDKIGCAAFCEIIYDKNWLGDTEHRIKVCKDFALIRYGIDIENSLAYGNIGYRDTHKKRLSGCFS